MNSDPLVSDLVLSLRTAFRPYEPTGVELAPKAVSTLLRNLCTIEQLARNQEEELAIRDEIARISLPSVPRLAGPCTIVPFPRRGDRP